MKSILFTTFSTWEKEQLQNSSDLFIPQFFSFAGTLFDRVDYCRHLPVKINNAKKIVYEQLEKNVPDLIVLSGMAESREFVFAEKLARKKDKVCESTLQLNEAIEGTDIRISDNAGQFVCENLYYNVLNYCKKNKLKSKCVFIHVPLLSKDVNNTFNEDFKKFLTNIHSTL